MARGRLPLNCVYPDKEKNRVDIKNIQNRVLELKKELALLEGILQAHEVSSGTVGIQDTTYMNDVLLPARSESEKEKVPISKGKISDVLPLTW